MLFKDKMVGFDAPRFQNLLVLVPVPGLAPFGGPLLRAWLFILGVFCRSVVANQCCFDSSNGSTGKFAPPRVIFIDLL